MFDSPAVTHYIERGVGGIGLKVLHHVSHFRETSLSPLNLMKSMANILMKSMRDRKNISHLPIDVHIRQCYADFL